MYTPTLEADSFSKEMIQKYAIGSALLNRQTETAVETAELANRLQQWAAETESAIPLFISGDMEYGAAQRVPGEATVLPRSMAIAATGKVEYAELAAKLTAEEAKALGFQWSFSPVADVNANPLNPVIGVRSFGGDANVVSRMVVAQVKAYADAGVIASAKHFPGHGDTAFDSHSTLSKVTYSGEVLRSVHLAPFKAAIDAGIPAIMTAHVIVEAIDPNLPATLSEKVLTGLLRKEMGFEGIIVTDAMVMEAISNHWGAGEAAVMAINAGADIVMANGSEIDQVQTAEALYEALQNGNLKRSRVEESVQTILEQKIRLGMFESRYVDVKKAENIVGSDVYKEQAARIAADSITLLRNEGVLPFDAESNETTFVVSMVYGEEIAESVKRAGAGNVIAFQAAEAAGERPDTDKTAIQEAVRLAETADRIAVFTYSDRQIPNGQIELVRRLTALGKPIAVVSLGLPSDITAFPDVPAYLAAYALDTWYWVTPIPVSWEAAVHVLFGTEPVGKLPLRISDEYEQGFGLRYGGLASGE
ncbi:glycoside hydrolase family 3 protein [Paenibacillus sp. M.A.Huq-81]